MSTANSVRTPKTQLDLSYKVLSGLVTSFSNDLLPDTQMRQWTLPQLSRYNECVYDFRLRLQSIINDGATININDFCLVQALILDAARLLNHCDENAILSHSEIMVYNLLVNDIQSFRNISQAFAPVTQELKK